MKVLVRFRGALYSRFIKFANDISFKNNKFSIETVYGLTQMYTKYVNIINNNFSIVLIAMQIAIHMNRMGAVTLFYLNK